MKRVHMHIRVEDLDLSKQFYSGMLAAEPVIEKHDYARWELSDPPLTLALSNHQGPLGIDHVGIKASSEEELSELNANLQAASIATADEKDAQCCYARSDKHWVQDPQNVVWEVYRTMDTIPVYGTDMGPLTAEEPAPEPEAKPKAERCC